MVVQRRDASPGVNCNVKCNFQKARVVVCELGLGSRPAEGDLRGAVLFLCDMNCEVHVQIRSVSHRASCWRNGESHAL